MNYLIQLGHHLPEQGVQHGQLAAQVDVALEGHGVGHAVQVGDLVQELLHGAPLHLQELVHVAHVLLLSPKPVGRGGVAGEMGVLWWC